MFPILSKNHIFKRKSTLKQSVSFAISNEKTHHIMSMLNRPGPLRRFRTTFKTKSVSIFMHI